MTTEQVVNSTEYRLFSWALTRFEPPRIIFGVVLGFVFSALSWLLPKYIAYLYMRNYGFYDYEFMESNLASTIVLLNFFIIIPTFVSLGSSAYFIRKCWETNRMASFFLLFALLSVLGLLLFAAITAPLLRFIIFCGFIATTITVLYICFDKVKIFLLPLIILAVPAIIVGSIIFTESMVDQYEKTLKQNGLGGFSAEIELITPLNPNRVNFPDKKQLSKDGKTITAHVALISQNNIYITTNQWLPNSKENKIHRAIIPKSNVLLMYPY